MMRDESNSELHVVSLEEESNSDIEMREAMHSAVDASAFEEYRRQMSPNRKHYEPPAMSYDAPEVMFDPHSGKFDANSANYDTDHTNYDTDHTLYDTDRTDGGFSEAENETMPDGYDVYQNLSNGNDS